MKFLYQKEYVRFTSSIELAGLPRYYTRLYKNYLQHWEDRVAKVLYKIYLQQREGRVAIVLYKIYLQHWVGRVAKVLYNIIQHIPPVLRGQDCQGIIQYYTAYTSSIEGAGLPRYYTRLYKNNLQHWEGRVAKVLYKIILELPPALRG